MNRAAGPTLRRANLGLRTRLVAVLMPFLLSVLAPVSVIAPVSAQDQGGENSPEDMWSEEYISQTFPWAPESNDRLQFREYHDYFSMKARMQALADQNPGFLEYHEGLLGGVKGSRALSLGISLLLFVEMIDTLDSAIDQMVWDEELVHATLSLLSTLYILIFLFASYRLVGSIGKVLSDDGESPASQRSLASMAESLGRMAVFVVGAFVVAGVVGFDLNGIIAGLGITGLAAVYRPHSPR